eukprot:g33924.t1
MDERPKGTEKLLCALLHRDLAHPAIPDRALQADGFSIHHMDCMVSSGKAKDSQVCFLINTSWCSDVVTLESHCSPDLKYLPVKCCPYSLPRESTSATLTAVYILSHVDEKNALDGIYTTAKTLETKFPESLFIVASDFNQANLQQ